MIRLVLILLALNFRIIFPGVSYSQDHYWIVFADKNGVSFDPESYFQERTIQKRIKLNIPLNQYSDLPLREDYVDGIRSITEINIQSRWLNAVSVRLNKEQYARISELAWVKEIRAIKGEWEVTGKEEINPDPEELDHISKQVNSLGAGYFREKGVDGKGVRIAVFDIGFSGVDTLKMFKKIRDEGRIIATYDFVKKCENLYNYSTHGTTVLACIAGSLDSLNFGLGTGAEFLLARTEVKAEIFKEEEYWAAAMEWADKNGADIISSSLGYTSDRYFPKQMDGKTVFVTRMANLAASKGMLVINAAGNDGDKDWEVIGAPADADSVLSVGGIGPNGIHISFSSFGPSYDGRMKPNVAAFGEVITATKGTLKKSYGTSFATPLVTGFAACVMQMHPDWDNMKVFGEIQKSGHLYPYFDYAHGFGVPQATYFLSEGKENEKSFEFVPLVDILEIKLIIKEPVTNDDSAENVLRNYSLDDQYLYYKISDPDTGKIRKYAVVLMSNDDKFNLPFYDLKKGEKVSAFYRGYTADFVF